MVTMGHFVGAFGREIKNIQIPAMAIDERFRSGLTEVYFRQGVASIKSMIDSSENGSMRIPWPAEAYQLVGQGDIIADMNLIQAIRVINISELTGTLDAVRNKILNFVLELETRDPEAGEAVKERGQIPKDQVQHIFKTIIKGDVANLAQGSSHFIQEAAVQVRKGDIDALLRAVSNLGVSPEDTAELRFVVEQEPKCKRGEFGSKVSAWIGKIVSKAAHGAYEVTTKVVADVAAEALKRYYGI
jgi:hypothetical protein